MTSPTPCRSLLLGALLAAALLPSAVIAQEAPVEVKWRRDYAAARKEAQEKSLPLVIDFGTKNCFWCRKLDESTLRDPRVVRVMNERFVPLRVDADEERQLTQTLRITSFPTVVLASPDGRILGSPLEGFQEADPFHENLQRVLASITPPEWMQRDLANATKWSGAGEYARAIGALRSILEDGKARPLQSAAQKLMQDIERKAMESLARARQFHDKGQLPEAMELLTDITRIYPGLQSTRDAVELLSRLAQNAELRAQQRTRRAKELMTQAQEFYKSKDYIPCLDRCELLLAQYRDLPEGEEATALSLDIKTNSEWLQSAADTMSERLGGLYLSLADNLLQRGQVQRAEFYLQRVIHAFPGSRQAESAQTRLGQLNSAQPQRTAVQSARP